MMEEVTLMPIHVTVQPERQMELRVVLLESGGGILLCVDTIPHAFASDLATLKKRIVEVLDNAFALVGKEAPEDTTQPQE